MAPVKSKDAEAPKKKPAVKAAPQKVEKMILQFQEGEWELSSVKEQAIAAPSQPHREWMKEFRAEKQNSGMEPDSMPLLFSD